MIEFDVETTGLQWYADEMFLAQFLDSDGGKPALFAHPGNEEKVQTWLNRHEDFRAWNAKFDLHFLDAAGYELPPEDRWHDGMVAAHILDERRSVALQNKANAILGSASAGTHTEEAVSEWLMDETKRRRKAAKETGGELVKPNYSDVPDEIMYPYAAHDVEIQRGVCDQLMPLLEQDAALKSVYTLEMGVLAALFHMEKRGVPIDRTLAARYEAASLQRLDECEQRSKDLAGIDTFNPGAPKQVEEALERRGADLSFARETKTGRSMDEESLSAVDDELAKAVLEFRDAKKLYGTYLKPMLHATEQGGIPRSPYIAGDERLHPNFRQVGARTGRMSCSDPNIQNWHRDNLDLRYLIRAEPGHVLVAADLDAIEMRIYAAYCGQGTMLSAIKEGRDMHQMVADAIGLSARERIGGVESPRQRGKKFNYSMAYGAGVRSIRRAFGVNQTKARNMIDRWRALFPEAVALQDRITYKLIDQGYVTTRWGRRQRVDRNARQESYKFTNYLIQGTAADLLKAACVRLHKEGVPVVAPVHDELVAHCRTEDAPEVADALQRALVEHPMLTDHVPLEAEAKIVNHWSQVKDVDYVPSYVS